jgi:hypothetical protein
MIEKDIDLDAARAHIEALTGSPDTRMTFQLFDDKKLGRRGLTFWDHGMLSEWADRLTQKNLRGAGIFIMVNAGDFKGRSKGNVAALRALFIDVDDGRARELALPSSFTVRTKRGFHAYWKLDADEPLTSFEPAQRWLAKFYGSDTTTADLCKVMRLAGFLHFKEEPFKVTFEPGRRS